MIISTGLGDNSSDVIDVSGGGNDPTLSGITIILIGFGLFFVVSKMFGSNKSSGKRYGTRPTTTRVRQVKPPPLPQRDYKLEVDITGNGRWVTQAEGTKVALEKEARAIRAKEGMKTRII